NTFITFHYGKASERILLQRYFSGWTLLNIESWGIGFLFDDAIGGWQGYDDLHVYLNPNGGTDSALQVRPPGFWESNDRPRLLISGSWGVNSAFAPPGEVDFFVPPYYDYGVGLSYQH